MIESKKTLFENKLKYAKKVKVLKCINVGIRLNPKERAQLHEYCVNEGKTISNAIRDLMKDNIFALSGER
jgi:hypothetical protein